MSVHACMRDRPSSTLEIWSFVVYSLQNAYPMKLLPTLCFLALATAGASNASTCFVEPVWRDSEVGVKYGLPYGSNFNNQTGKVQELTLDLYTPPASDTRTARPAAVLVHGGSFETGSSVSDDEPAFALQLERLINISFTSNFNVFGRFVQERH